MIFRVGIDEAFLASLDVVLRCDVGRARVNHGPFKQAVACQCLNGAVALLGIQTTRRIDIARKG